MRLVVGSVWKQALIRVVPYLFVYMDYLMDSVLKITAKATNECVVQMGR